MTGSLLKRFQWSACFLLALLLAGPRARAQCDGQWSVPPGSFNISYVVQSVGTWDPDGTGPLPPLLVIGGTFSLTTPTCTATNLAAFDGVSWRAMGDPNGSVEAISTFNGDLVVGGTFTRIGGQSANRIARYNGAAWSRFAAGVTARVTTITQYQSDLFANPGGALMRWNGTAWIDLNTLRVEDLIVYHDELVAGGFFSRAGGPSGPTVNNIARWNGTRWATLGAGLTGATGNGLQRMCVHNDRLIAVGNFFATPPSGTAAIQAWDGTAWSGIGAGFPLGGVYSLRSFQGLLVVSGNPTGAIPAGKNIYAWNGVTWSPLAEGIDSRYLYGMTEFQNELVVGGEFLRAGQTSASRVARWNGSSWFSFGSGPRGDIDGGVTCMSSDPAGLAVGGRFNWISGVAAPGLALLSGDSWSAITGRESLLGTSNPSSVMWWRRELYVTSSSGTQRIARWDGTTWRSVGGGLTPLSFNSSAQILFADADGLYVSGDFSRAGGLAAGGLARWDGAAWSPLGQTFTGGTVSAITRFGDRVIFAGSFTGAGGTPARNIAAWDGVAFTPLGTNFPGAPQALAVYRGELYAGGYFSSFGSSVIRWDGSAWVPVGVGFNQGLSDLKVFDDEIYACGSFSNLGTNTGWAIARWNGVSWRTVGGSLTNLLSRTTNSPFTWKMEVAGGHILVGGNFDLAGPVYSPFLSIWTPDHPWTSVSGDPHPSACEPFRFTAAATGLAPLTYAWRRDGVSLADGPTPEGAMISGSGAASLLVSNPTALESGRYTCVVTNTCGSSESNPLDAIASLCCSADFDGSGSLNADDLGDFITCFFSNPPCASSDFNRDSNLDADDLGDFITAYFAGC